MADRDKVALMLPVLAHVLLDHANALFAATVQRTLTMEQEIARRRDANPVIQWVRKKDLHIWEAFSGRAFSELLAPQVGTLFSDIVIPTDKGEVQVDCFDITFVETLTTAPFDVSFVARGWRLNIHDLAERTGSAERQIRYMIAQGFVPPPRGPRSSPDYGEDHIEAIRRYLGLREMGLPPAAIRVLSERKSVVVLSLIDGVSLSIEQRLIGRPLDVAAISARLITLLQQLESESSS